MKKRKTMIVFAVVLLLCALLAPRASADGLQFCLYLDADGLEAAVNADNVTRLANAADLTLSNGWYIVDSNVTVENGIVAEGSSVYLILGDNATLTVGQTFTVKDDADSNPGFVNIYCQSGGTGTLSAGGIAVENGDLFIHGGVISVSGGIAASNGSVSVRWSTPENSVTAATYGNGVAFDDTFGIDGTNVPVSPSNLSTLGGEKLIPALIVSFESGDGTGTMDNVAVPASNPSYTLPACTFTPQQYMTFDHWEEVEDAVSTPVSSPLTLTNQYTTLVAKYKSLPDYKVSFDPGDGSGSMEDATVSVSNPSYTLPQCTFTPPQYMTFDHWEELDGTVSTPVSDPMTLTKAETVLVAKYKSLPDYIVKFDPGEGSGTMNSVSVPASSPSCTLPECTFTPPQYMTFDHWEELDGTVSTPVSDPMTLTKPETTLIAKYKTIEAPPQPEQVSWLLENGVLTISGTGSMEDYAKGGAPWFARRAEITSVVIGSGIDHIGAYAFYACGAIESVTIQGSGVSVGDRAFSYCCAVSAVTLGENASISAIGEGAFYACFKLANRGFVGSATVGNKAFELCGL